MLTLGQAAKIAPVSKSAISKAIKSGRMSAGKDDKGFLQIDPAELYRVFPQDTGNSTPTVESVRQETRKETSDLQATVEHLRELLQQIKSERDDLRTDRDKWREQATLALLTHQPEPKADPTPAPATEAAPVVRLAVWIAATAAALIAAATWGLWWPWWTGRN